MEVAAIDHRRNVQVFVDEPPAPGLLGTVVNHPPCNMMDNTHSHVSIGSLPGAQYVDTRAPAPLAYVETEAVRMLADLPQPQLLRPLHTPLHSLLAQRHTLTTPIALLHSN